MVGQEPNSEVLPSVGKKLVIVESPAKARTVGRFLGGEYAVEASIGHIRDLPQKQLGVDIRNNFEPHYVVPAKKKDVVKKLKEQAKLADEIYLATDPDREGEAISWHLVQALKPDKGKPVHRVEFHEITREAIDHAFANPRGLNLRLVDAQQARRILDRLVGYPLSSLLRQKITKKGLSAGRVQSVALRLVVEREREIERFVPDEYWSIEATLSKRPEGRRAARSFSATLNQIGGEKVEIKNGQQAEAIRHELEGAYYRVSEVRRREVQRNPAAPFTTSTMQQEASRKLGFTAKRTMGVAQGLYEGVPIGEGEGAVGLITYMRTDSTNLAETAVSQIRRYIASHYGPDFVPPAPRVFKTRAKGAQEAHEAIRPTNIEREPDQLKPYLSADQYKLYRLIWQRTVACQMAAAVMDTTSVDILAGRSEDNMLYLFRATGSTVKFPGFTRVYTEGRDEEGPEEEESGTMLPPLEVGEAVDLVKLSPEQHFTQPPPRYTEATLVKALEEYGIGRPSTYAPTMATIQDRGYVERVDKKLKPTFIGMLVNDLLVQHFPAIVDVGFTAEMEGELDEIASGEREWQPVVRSFYEPFEETLERARTNMQPVEIKPEPTDIICEKCGRPMVIKYGRFGRFVACTGYPACRNSKSITVPTGVKCPECGADLVEKKTRRKRIFYSCANYPQCTFSVWNRPLPVPCPHCGGLLTAAGKHGAKCIKCQASVELPEAEEAVSDVKAVSV